LRGAAEERNQEGEGEKRACVIDDCDSFAREKSFGHNCAQHLMHHAAAFDHLWHKFSHGSDEILAVGSHRIIELENDHFI
jgi:hypothetical protein